MKLNPQEIKKIIREGKFKVIEEEPIQKGSVRGYAYILEAHFCKGPCKLTLDLPCKITDRRRVLEQLEIADVVFDGFSDSSPDVEKPTLHIVRGLPGTGKSTFVQKRLGGMLQIENDHIWITPSGDYRYIEAEDSRQRCNDYVKHMVTAAMQRRVNLAVSRVGMSLESIQSLVELANEFGYNFKIWRMDDGNMEFFSNKHNVPDKAMKFMKDNFVKTLPWKQVLVKVAPRYSHSEYSYSFRSIKARKPKS